MRARRATPADAVALAALLATVVDEGRTAIDVHLSPAELDDWFITGQHAIACHVVESDEADAPLGFQVLERFHVAELPAGWADAATFVAASARGRGVGRALLAATVDAARAAGIHTLRAVIGGTNADAIAAYRAWGFAEAAEVEAAEVEAAEGATESVVLVRHVGERPSGASAP